MSKSIEATIGERVAAVGLLNAGKFNNLALSDVLSDIKKFAVTEEEWAQANLTKTPTDEQIAALDPEARKGAAQTWTWDETILKTLDLEQGTVDALQALIKEKSDNKELTLQDAALLSLQKKLEA